MMLLSLEPKHELYIIPKWIYADRIVKKVDVCFFDQIVKIVDVSKTSPESTVGTLKKFSSTTPFLSFCWHPMSMPSVMWTSRTPSKCSSFPPPLPKWSWTLFAAECLSRVILDGMNVDFKGFEKYTSGDFDIITSLFFVQVVFVFDKGID